jgi:GT2 family glycosyltransferase
MEEIEVSIIIVNYNTKELTRNCLYSVFEKTQNVNFEVIVVDNASIDGSQKMLKKEFPNVRLIENNENLGFGRANNLGARYAKGKYLFLLNSDTILLNNAVKILADFLNKNTNVGICGGNLYDNAKKTGISYDDLPSIGSELKMLLHIPRQVFNFTNKPKQVGFICGADMMVVADLFNQLNGFDSDFFAYYEETELTFRLKKIGYSVICVPQAQIIHLVGQSWDVPEQKMKIIMNSRNMYYKKTHFWLYHKIANGIFYLAVVHRIVVLSFFHPKTRANYWKCVLRNFINS